ncbi:hypothetical protein PABG_01176 [Paracoccidioides brasiliensis Pb03]|nr:hypothetical protein PABG_01176 [Paracoccidioides brasiliensis Pb03]
MDAKGFEDILLEFFLVIERIKPLSRDIRDILFLYGDRGIIVSSLQDLKRGAVCRSSIFNSPGIYPHSIRKNLEKTRKARQNRKMREETSELSRSGPIAAAVVDATPFSCTTTTTVISEPSLDAPLKIASSPPQPNDYFYFAYGSNLSHSQMCQRCVFNPAISAKPLAIARLDRWKWFICEAGYANVLPPDSLSNPSLEADDEVVYGVLYKMTPEDEDLLDRYEGVDRSAPPTPPDGPVGRHMRPREQGKGSYNKWYVPATVVKWLDESVNLEWDEAQELTVLVYVNEYKVKEGPPKQEYIRRMNRGIREAEALGFPADANWVERVMRRFIPNGPDAGLES